MKLLPFNIKDLPRFLDDPEREDLLVRSRFQLRADSVSKQVKSKFDNYLQSWRQLVAATYKADGTVFPEREALYKSLREQFIQSVRQSLDDFLYYTKTSDDPTDKEYIGAGAKRDLVWYRDGGSGYNSWFLSPISVELTRLASVLHPNSSAQVDTIVQRVYDELSNFQNVVDNGSIYRSVRTTIDTIGRFYFPYWFYSQIYATGTKSALNYRLKDLALTQLAQVVVDYSTFLDSMSRDYPSSYLANYIELDDDDPQAELMMSSRRRTSINSYLRELQDLKRRLNELSNRRTVGFPMDVKVRQNYTSMMPPTEDSFDTNTVISGTNTFVSITNGSKLYSLGVLQSPFQFKQYGPSGTRASWEIMTTIPVVVDIGQMTGFNLISGMITEAISMLNEYVN